MKAKKHWILAVLVAVSSLILAMAAQAAAGVKIWYTAKAYTEKGPMGNAMKDKANWVQVPYGRIDYQPSGDLMLEGQTFYLFLFTNKDDSVDLMAKMGPDSFKSNEIYKVNDTGGRNFGHGTMWTEILKNTPDEVIIKHAGEGQKDKQPVVTIYRILAGKPWLEVRPVERVNQQGMHGKSRICAFVKKDGDDFILDSKREPFTGEINVSAPEGTIGIINFNRGYSGDHDFMWFMTFPQGTEKHPLTYLGFHADPFWEDDVFISPTTEKTPARLLHSRVQMEAGQPFTFRRPVKGTLDYLLVYLWDRTDKTTKTLWTPMDVYRETIEGRRKGGR